VQLASVGRRRVAAWQAALAATVLSLPAAPSRADQLDQSFEGPGAVATVDVRDDFSRAQTFTVGVDGLLTRVALVIGKSAETFDTDEVRVDVRPTDESGTPLEDPGSALASVTVPASQLANVLDPGDPLEIDLSAAGVQVTAGQRLALVASSDVPFGELRAFSWYGFLVPAGGYAGGDAWLHPNPGTWALQNGGGVDLFFRTYVEAPEPLPGAAAAAAGLALAALGRAGSGRRA
jgi:hypothetical protein